MAKKLSLRDIVKQLESLKLDILKTNAYNTAMY